MANRSASSTDRQRAVIGRRLDQFRPYLRLLARMQIEANFQPKLDASGLVQQTIVEAYRKFEQFRGENDAQLAGWLRAILANSLADEVRRFTAQKRCVFDEYSLHDQVEKSSVRLEEMLQDRQELTPSSQAVHNEELLALAEGLESLREDYRQAVEWHHLHGLKLSEIAQRMGKTPGQVAGLLRQGLKELRKRMNTAP
jgi:RNA polymerase sigma-70 factor (ECF subfamily)